MEINNLEMYNNIKLDNNLVNEKTQNKFLESILGKTINTAIDVGIRALLPDFVEEQVIQVKNNFFNYGLKEGITKTIDDAIDLGKSVIGIVTGKFENVSQMQNAVQSGGIIEGMSSLLDMVVDKIQKAGVINGTVGKTIKQGKNLILNNIERNINNTFVQQYEIIEKTNKYINSWKSFLEDKNFNGMQKEYNKIAKQLKNLAPIEKTINDVKTIQLLHNLIKNKGQDFNLTKDELDLVEKLK